MFKKVICNKFWEEKNNFQIWHAHHKATGMTIFCWAKTISNNSLILTNYFEKHLKLTHWYDGPIWIKPLKEVFLGPRGPHGIPSHIITGIYASWIIWRLIKPTPPQPSTAQCSLIPVQPSTAKYSQYPNPTRNPNFLVKPDPNPTRSQKALLVMAGLWQWKIRLIARIVNYSKLQKKIVGTDGKNEKWASVETLTLALGQKVRCYKYK